jgi:aspartate 1-decarboxylase
MKKYRRPDTYVVKGKRGSGICRLNEPAARKGMASDIIIIISYDSILLEEAKQFKPHIVFSQEGDKL